MPKYVDHDARRKDFIAAAHESILEEGLAKTTIRSVAKRAGYTTGALVHYFADKEELIKQVLEENGQRVRARMQSAQHTQQGFDALRGVLLEALPTDKTSGASWRIWLALWYHSEESASMRLEERRRYKEWLGRLGDILQQSVDLGELPADTNVTTEARMLVAFVDGLGVQYLMANSRTSAGQLKEMLDRYLVRLYQR
ncbi:MAG: TetR/AcrR family transcriptional regulator [bacterium]